MRKEQYYWCASNTGVPARSADISRYTSTSAVTRPTFHPQIRKSMQVPAGTPAPTHTSSNDACFDYISNVLKTILILPNARKIRVVRITLHVLTTNGCVHDTLVCQCRLALTCQLSEGLSMFPQSAAQGGGFQCGRYLLKSHCTTYFLVPILLHIIRWVLIR